MISSTIMSPLHALQAKASLEALRVHIHQILIYFPYPNDPAKKLNFPQIFRNFAQKLPKMAQSGPNMTQKGLKWPKNDPKWPKNDPKWPKNVLQFFFDRKGVLRTFSLLECMTFSEKHNLSPALSNDLPHDDVPVQFHRQPRRLCCLDFIPGERWVQINSSLERPDYVVGAPSQEIVVHFSQLY